MCFVWFVWFGLGCAALRCVRWWRVVVGVLVSWNIGCVYFVPLVWRYHPGLSGSGWYSPEVSHCNSRCISLFCLCRRLPL